MAVLSTGAGPRFSMDVYRILSIDGGGIKGVFPAALLATVEKTLPKPVGSYFDLIVGTSTGGIIALGLGLGFSAAELLEFYETLGPRIFKGNRLGLWFKHWGATKYSPAPLREALESRFGDRRIGEAKTRLVIPSMNIETGKVHIYKTAHHPKFEIDYPKLAVEAAMATAAAPTFFPTHHTSSNIPLVDGGVWANNPVGMAVVEGIGVLGWEKEKIRVLSIGCTSAPLDIGIRRRFNLGKIFWANKVTDIFMAGQCSASLGTAYTLVGHDSVVRIDPVVPKGRYDLDVHKEIKSLRGLGKSEGREALPKLKEMFFCAAAEPFTPYRS